jgi:hypothetical protein
MASHTLPAIKINPQMIAKSFPMPHLQIIGIMSLVVIITKPVIPVTSVPYSTVDLKERKR